MPKSLADAKTKFTVLTAEPTLEGAPTATELNGGLDMSCNVLFSDFLWTPTDSDKVQERALCDRNNANALGPENFQAGVTVFRYFDESTGEVDPVDDVAFDAMRERGTELWGYIRRTGKDYDEPWADTDEIACGMKIITDTPQSPQDLSGYIKYRVPMEPQKGWPFIAATGA